MQAAEQVDLVHKLPQSFESLSGGEKQRALIARAIIQQPDILLLDEPTNHLDIRHQIEILDLVRQLQITSLVSVHDLNLAAAYCDRIVLLSKGKLVIDGTPEQVLTPEVIAEVFQVKAQVERVGANQLRVSYEMGGI